MRQELIPITRARPPVVWVPGMPPHGPIAVYVSIHDAWYRARRTRWRRRLSQMHPDTEAKRLLQKLPGHGLAMTGACFRQRAPVFRNWLKREAAWYRQFGLELPD